MSGNTIQKIQRIVLQARHSHFSFTYNTVFSIDSNGIFLVNNFMEMSHNNFHMLSSSEWLILKGECTSVIAFNTFNQPVGSVKFEGYPAIVPHYCSFHDNIIHQVANNSLDSIFDECLIENVSFEVSCDCEMKTIPKSYNYQSKCFVSDVERFLCFKDRYMYIEEYHKSSCEDHMYMAWSECGTKINAMIIGLSVGIGIIIGNIIICYIWKRKKLTKQVVVEVRKRSYLEDYYCSNDIS